MSSSSTANFPTTLPKSFPTVIDDNSKKDPEESVDFTGDFKTKFSPENLTRLAGALGDLFGQGEGGEIYKELTKRMEESKEELLEMTDKTRDEVDYRLGEIYPGLTGLTGEEALNRYRDEFEGTVTALKQEGRSDLYRNPDLSPQLAQTRQDLQDIKGQFSLAEQIGGYPKTVLDPAVVKSNTDRLKGTMTGVGNAIKAEGSMDYSDPQTQYFISGLQRDRAAAIGDYLANSADVGRLMNYGNIG
jgi:hypothetical protein